MRVGELIGLRWEDIDFFDEVIYIKQAISQGIIGTPKTKSSIREIDMLPIVKEALQRQYQITGNCKEGYLFLTQHGKHYKTAGSILDFFWKPLLKKCKMDYKILYQTRHTFASIMIQKGEEIGWVSATMGHKNMNVTLSKYARFIPRKNKKRATFLDDLELKAS